MQLNLNLTSSFDTNLLPYQGQASYTPVVFSDIEANIIFKNLLEHLEWRYDEVTLFGKKIITARKIAWYGDSNYAYTYSNSKKEALKWSKILLRLKLKAEAFSKISYNSCLANLYHNGNEGVGWHSDNEKTLGEQPHISVFSFGAERKFLFKHKRTKLTIPLILNNGSLLVMKEYTQKNWLHSLPKTTKITIPRISLTFRRIFN